MSRKTKFTPETIALAYELRVWGASWKNIARGLGGREINAHESIRRVVNQAIKDGVSVQNAGVRA